MPGVAPEPGHLHYWDVKSWNTPTPFVGSFVGALSVLVGTVVDPQTGVLEVADQTLRIGAAFHYRAVGDTVSIAPRPERILLQWSTATSELMNELHGTVIDVGFLGSIVRMRIRVGDQVIQVDTLSDPDDPPV